MKKLKIDKNLRSSLITYGMIIVAYVVMQSMVNSGSVSSLMEGLLVPLCIYSIMAVSLNLTVGILGELSLGHAGFMCIGAFAGAFFSKCTVGTMPDLTRFILAILIGAIMAGIFGFLVGIPVLRLKGDYLAIVTLGFGEIVKNLVNAFYIGRDSNGFHISLKSAMELNLGTDGEVILKGAQGITRTPQDSTFTIGIIVLLISVAIVLNFVNSRSGRAVMAIRDNRIAAESVGINVTKYKLMAFSISAALAGCAGVLYAHNLTTLTALPKNFGYNQSIMILIFVVLGGIGNITGSIIGAVVLTLLPEMIRELGEYRMLVYAIVLIVMMLLTWSPKAKLLRERFSPKKMLEAKKAQKEGN